MQTPTRLLSLGLMLVALAIPGQGRSTDPGAAKPGAPAPASPPAPAAAEKPAEPGAAAAAPIVSLRLPLLDERLASVPVAVIDDEVVTMRDLGEALATSHQDRKKAKVAVLGGGKEFQGIVERIVDMRLIVREAREMGLDQLPEVTRSLQSFQDTTLRTVLKRQVVADVKPDPKTAEEIYKGMVRTFKALSLLFDKKEDAEKLPELLAGGEKLEDVAKRLVADKKAKGDGVPHEVAAMDLVPQVRIALEATQPGALTKPIQVGKAFVVVRLDEVTYPESAEKRAEAAEAAQVVAEKEAWEKFFYGLSARYLKRDDRLAKAVDFQAPKPGFRALTKDRRVLARIQGEKPITVADVAADAEAAFFHGVDEAIQEKRMNDQKWKSLDKLVYHGLLRQEASRRKIAASDEYRREVEQYTNTVLFGTFVQRVLLPDLKVQEEEVQKYYEAHKADFTYPGFYKLDGVAFPDAKRAQAALDQLKAGTDLRWLRANAEGQIRGDDRALQLDGTTYAANRLPSVLSQALTNAAAGDLKLVAFGGQYNVVSVLDVTPAQPQPVDEVKPDILKKLMDEHMTASVKDWAAKLRKVHATRIFVSSSEG